MADAVEENKVAPLPRGAYSRIARRMRPKVTPQHVRLVAIGKSTSKRVSAALERYRASLVSAA
jgi:hypothetical protein